MPDKWNIQLLYNSKTLPSYRNNDTRNKFG